ncbi:MAG: S8 family serine peptidase [Chloroflexota bacterium]
MNRKKLHRIALLISTLFLSILQLFLLQPEFHPSQAASLVQTGGLLKKSQNIDSNLNNLHQEWITHQNSGNQEPFAPGDPSIPIIEEEYVVIDAVATSDLDALRLLLESQGLRNTSVYGKMISGEFPIEKLDGLVDEDVLQIMRPAYAITNGMAEAIPRAMPQVGLVDSQGDVAMRSNIARAIYGVDGSGITIGTLSDSYDCASSPTTNATQDVANGDLPSGINVLDDTQCPGSDEGRAMMQLIADVAPGAGQAFHTAFGGQADFANGIIELQGAGADVIVDDVIYFAEPFFQDGIIAQAVDQVYAAGVSYFSSAGNSARDSYESAFDNSGEVGPLFSGLLHDFDPGPGVDTRQRVTIPSGATVRISFQWDQPFASVSGSPGSTSDIDIGILDTSGNVVAASFDGNIGGDPVEIVIFSNGTTNTAFDIIISKYSGSDPGLMKYIDFGTMTINEFDTDSSTIVGHANASGAEAVGAAWYFQTPAFGVSPAVLEAFSSGGNTPILFDTAGNSVNIIRQKPEIVAPDGTNTTFFGGDAEGDGFPNFFGTSAAAPHAAAVAALLLEQNAILSPQLIYDILQFGANDMGVSGFDLDSGYGLIEADSAVADARLITSPFGGKPTAMVTQVGPNSSINTTSPTFVWDALADATEYQVVLYSVSSNGIVSDERYTNEEATCLLDNECSVTLATALDPGQYLWLVRAINLYGEGPWSLWQ